MMNLYFIDKRIEALLSQIDEETGEACFSFEELDALMENREEALEQTALFVKNCRAEAMAIRAEEIALAKRRRTLESEAERSAKYVEYSLKGEPYKTPRVAVSYRASEAVEVTDEFFEWAKTHPEYVRVRAEADKTALKAALKGGEEIVGAELVTHMNMSIR